ncbi:MAG: UDP-N-acetylglucosamine 2-epimerase (hydrolyzing) [Phycisphaera sp.]|nr:UDP-N-acetylglucosamine 2-epimerase (hydrolyzing) [Phycisphaera sp.]
MNDGKRRKIAVVTGTRAEWGLLSPVCDAIVSRGDLALEVCAGGAHLLQPPVAEDRALHRAVFGEPPPFEPTIIWVESSGHRPHRFEMQRAGETGRLADAAALGRGVSALTEIFARLAPDIVVVLGDRIEAFAAASAASIGGIRVAHIHGGDRAEGVADEAMRHAITKLAHIHFAASAASAARIARLGEDAARIHLVGSPAVDGLGAIRPLSDHEYAELGAPDFVFLMHPVGRPDAEEEREAHAVLEALAARGRVTALAPNSDPGRNGIARAIEIVAERRRTHFRAFRHIERELFIALLKHPGVRAIVGNSSAGLIECAALGVRAVNIGSRQAGRERADNARDAASAWDGLAEALDTLDTLDSWRPSGRHPYLEAGASTRIAVILATCDFSVHGLAKRCTY